MHQRVTSSERLSGGAVSAGTPRAACGGALVEAEVEAGVEMGVGWRLRGGASRGWSLAETGSLAGQEA